MTPDPITAPATDAAAGGLSRFAVAVVLEVDAVDGEAAEALAMTVVTRAVAQRGSEDPARADAYYASPARAIPAGMSHDSDPGPGRSYLYDLDAPELCS